MKKRILIVGAGFGGLRTALTLGKQVRKNGLAAEYEVALVDRSPLHIYTPLLYKLAASRSFNPDALAYPLLAILEETGVRFMEDSVWEMDLLEGDVHLSRGEELRCDYLVLAPGSETNYFDIPGLKENSLPLKTLQDAESIRGRVEALPASAKIVVGGGGPTGLELAAELKCNYGFDVTIIEAMPQIIPGFAPGIVERATERLKKIGVKILTNEPITLATTVNLKTKTGLTVPFDLLIWTGGVKVPEWVTKLPVKTEARGRIAASFGMECLPQTPDLRLAPMVYALGDAVCVYDKVGKPMPGVAPAAIDQGLIVAANILSDILAEKNGKNASHRAYSPARYPYVLPLGKSYAIGTIGPITFSGIAGWLFKDAITLDYLLSIMPFVQAFSIWRKS
jgi:NADH:ubiquinone reductase (H+-translocating)